MKKILAIVTLLLLFTLTTSNASATTVHFPSNKVHIPHQTISNKKNNYKTQETESEVETTTTQVKESKKREDLSPEEQRHDDKIILALFFFVPFILVTVVTFTNCMIDLRNIRKNSAHLSVSKHESLITKSLVVILLSSFLTLTLFGLIYYAFSSYILLGVAYVPLSVALFSYSADTKIPNISE